MKEKQPKGVLRCVQASAGDVEITEIQRNPSQPETKKRSKISESGNKITSRGVTGAPSITPLQGNASGEDKAPTGSTETTEQGGDGNPRRRMKNLAGFWAAPQTEDVKSFRKKRFQVDEGPNTSSLEGDEPERIVRADDARAAENKPQIEISEGHAKGIASMFLNKSTDTPKLIRRDKEFSSLEDGGVLLSNEINEKNTSSNSTKLRRRIKDIAGTFSSTSTDDGVQSPRRKNSTVPDSSDVEINSGTADEPVVLEKGRTRGLADRWQQQRVEQEAETARSGAEDGGRTKPAWLIELELAKELEPVVYENEPVVRDDVIRADDETTDVISAKVARQARQMWTTIIENDEIKKKDDSQAKSKSVAPLLEPDKSCSAEVEVVLDVKEADESKEIVQKETVVNKSNVLKKECKTEPKVKKQELNKKGKEVVSVIGTVELSQDVPSEVMKKSDKNTSDNTATELPQTRTILPQNNVDDDDDDDDDDEDDEDDDDEDHYFSNDESGLVLDGAVLMHIPRRKLIQSLRD